MAQQLIASGQEVGLLLLLDTPSPWAYTSKAWLGRLIGHLSNLRRFGLPYLTYKWADNRYKAGGNVAEVEPPAGAVVRRVARNGEIRTLFRRIASEYDIKRYPGRITLFALAERHGMTDGLFDPALGLVDPLLGWGRVADGGVQRHEMPGEHVTMLQEPHVQAVAETLQECLTAVREKALSK
jgi:thioesterase domain-containing protein